RKNLLDTRTPNTNGVRITATTPIHIIETSDDKTMLSSSNTYLPGHITLITQPSLARSRNRNSTIIVDDHYSSSRQSSYDNNISRSSPLSVTHSITKKSHESTDSGIDLSLSTSSSQLKLLQETSTQLNNNSTNTDMLRQTRPTNRPLSALSEESEFIQSGRQLIKSRKHHAQSDDEDDQGYDDNIHSDNLYSDRRMSSVDRHLNEVSPVPPVRLRQPLLPPITSSKEQQQQNRSNSFSNTEINIIDKNATSTTKLSKKLKRASDGALLDIITQEETMSPISYGNTKSLEQLNENAVPPVRRLSNRSDENILISLTNNNNKNRTDNRTHLNDKTNRMSNNHSHVKTNNLPVKNETNMATTGQYITNIDHRFHPHAKKPPIILKPFKKKKIAAAIGEPYNRDMAVSRLGLYHPQDCSATDSNTTTPRTITNKMKLHLETSPSPPLKQQEVKLLTQKSQTPLDFQVKTIDQIRAHVNRSVIDRVGTIEKQPQQHRSIQKDQLSKFNKNNTFQQLQPFDTIPGKKLTQNQQGTNVLTTTMINNHVQQQLGTTSSIASKAVAVQPISPCGRTQPVLEQKRSTPSQISSQSHRHTESFFSKHSDIQAYPTTNYTNDHTQHEELKSINNAYHSDLKYDNEEHGHQPYLSINREYWSTSRKNQLTDWETNNVTNIQRSSYDREPSTKQNETIPNTKTSQKEKISQEQKKIYIKDEKKIIEEAFIQQQSQSKIQPLIMPQVYRPQALGYILTQENLKQRTVPDEDDENYDSDDGWSVSSVDVIYVDEQYKKKELTQIPKCYKQIEAT
ncbi:unnamed protein product, partial [Didymodactylos carnosus]